MKAKENKPLRVICVYYEKNRYPWYVLAETKAIALDIVKADVRLDLGKDFVLDDNDFCVVDTGQAPPGLAGSVIVEDNIIQDTNSLIEWLNEQLSRQSRSTRCNQ
jgi:hypothetical protein